MQVYMSYNYPSVRLTLPEKNDVTYKSPLSRVLHVAHLIPCRKKADFALHDQTF